MMMVHARPRAHRSVFAAALAPAPLARGPWQVGFCAVLYVLRAVLTCCMQPVTVSVSRASARLLLGVLCEVGSEGIARCTPELPSMPFPIPLGNQKKCLAFPG